MPLFQTNIPDSNLAQNVLNLLLEDSLFTKLLVPDIQEVL